jgi:hypothetical protein
VTINLQLPAADGERFNFTATAHQADVQSMGEALPKVITIGHPRFSVEVVGFKAALAVVQALNPEISEADLRRLIGEQTIVVGEYLMGAQR